MCIQRCKAKGDVFSDVEIKNCVIQIYSIKVVLMQYSQNKISTYDFNGPLKWFFTPSYCLKRIHQSYKKEIKYYNFSVIFELKNYNMYVENNFNGKCIWII